MKKSLALTVVLLMISACLSACGTQKTIDENALITEITEKYSLSGGRVFSSASTETGEYLDSDLIRSYYGDAAEAPDFSKVEAYCVYIDESRPTNPCDVGIFRLAEGADTELFASFLKARIAAKLENAKNYPTVDTSPLTTAEVTVNGRYVYYSFVKDANSEIKTLIGDKLK